MSAASTSGAGRDAAAAPTAGSPPARFWIRVVGLVALRPRLWGIAVLQALRLARPRWWLRSPFLPLPDPEYLRFRLEAAYGDELRRAHPRDVLEYLEWCRTFPA